VGWEIRKGQSYYYSKVRVGNRVKSIYHGAGDDARLIAQRMEQQKDEEKIQREAKRQRRKALETIDAAAAEALAGGDDIIAASLLAGGFKKHRGQWRRRRIQDSAGRGAPGDHGSDEPRRR
jgi:hypothetical protein